MTIICWTAASGLISLRPENEFWPSKKLFTNKKGFPFQVRDLHVLKKLERLCNVTGKKISARITYDSHALPSPCRPVPSPAAKGMEKGKTESSTRSHMVLGSREDWAEQRAQAG